MKKVWIFKKSYIIIGAVLLMLLSLPLGIVQALRSGTVSVATPFVGDVDNVEEIHRLRLENSLLHFEIEKYRLLLEKEHLVNSQIQQLENVVDEGFHFESSETAGFLLSAKVAKVIYRDPASWSSMLWISSGESEGIVKNSPVLLGDSVVGVIDYVGSRKSRVRLITDSGLVPSVRVSRGCQQNFMLINRIDVLTEDLLSVGKDISEEEKINLLNALRSVKKSLSVSCDFYRLAKGELHGMGQPLWRSSGQILKGIGFNYDYPDNYGPARDLRTGISLSDISDENATPIIEEGDLLVTTGMDGVFPEGLPVARVSKIAMLREGAYMYELEARPVAGNLNELSTVFVIPPVGFDCKN